MENPKTIGNVNVLNLLHATEASAAGIQRIGNVNFALVTAETAPLLQRISVENLNVTLMVPADIKLVTQNGEFTINADYFKGIEQKIFFVVNGELIVEPGVPVEDIEKGLAGVGVNGQFCCPEDLMGVITAKSCHVNGETTAYPPFKHLVASSLILDAAYLNGLEDGAEISVLGGLSAPKVLDNSLLERKLGKLYVSGEILCHEENAQVIHTRLVKPARVNTIPAGFVWLREPLVLDSDMLGYLPGKKLFCKEMVRIEPDVQAGAFDQAVEALIVEDLLVCPSALKSVVAQKVSLFETKAIFYQGELWLVQNEQTLRSARFDSLSGSAALVVTGELTLDAALPAETLASRLSAIHNFGLIRCTPEQAMAVRSRLSKYEGEIEEVVPQTEETPAEEPHPGYLGNVNILAL